MNPILHRWRIALLVLFALSATVWLAAIITLRLVPSPTITPAASTVPPDCSPELAANLARAELVGQVAFLPDGTLAVEVQPPGGWPTDQAAQVVWAAFDAVISLPSHCSYQQVEVTVSTADVRLWAQVSANDLQAWAESALDDDSLANRVLFFEEPLTP